MREALILSLFLLTPPGLSRIPHQGTPPFTSRLGPTRVLPARAVRTMVVAESASPAKVLHLSGAKRNRAGHALLGGMIGGATGLVVCTVISNIVNDGNSFSTCTWKGYLGLGLGGAAAGAAVGALIK